LKIVERRVSPDNREKRTEGKEEEKKKERVDSK